MHKALGRGILSIYFGPKSDIGFDTLIEGKGIFTGSLGRLDTQKADE
jgi:hypothetical protein